MFSCLDILNQNLNYLAYLQERKSKPIGFFALKKNLLYKCALCGESKLGKRFTKSSIINPEMALICFDCNRLRGF